MRSGSSVRCELQPRHQSQKRIELSKGNYAKAHSMEKSAARESLIIDRAGRQIGWAAWCLAKSYWTSEEKWSAWGLLLGVIGLNLGNVYISVRINAWNNAFYNALQAFNSGELLRQLGIFSILVAFATAISVYALYLNQMLQVRWRRWMTRRYLDAWLSERAYYQLQLAGRTENPDQRISEDLNQFTAYVVSLSLGLITSVASLGSFLVILWGLSGPAEIPLGKMGNSAHTRVSGLGGSALRRCRDLADEQNRASAGAAEFRPAALRG
jgi:ABC-type uncharacterized transport system fused permease/ATPase subunit